MRLKILLLTALVLVVFCVGFLYRNRSKPLLYRYEDTAAVEHDSFIIQNPFRDRGLEDAAEAVLKQLKNHQCSQALSLRDLDIGRTGYLCVGEESCPLLDWSIMDRSDDDRHVHLIYRPYRLLPDSTGYDVPIDIDVEKLDGNWIAVNYDTAY